MEILGIRYILASDHAKDIVDFLQPLLDVPIGHNPEFGEKDPSEAGYHALFDFGPSRVGVYKTIPNLQLEGPLLALVVGDADAFAERARSRGVEVHGPMIVGDERIYFIDAPPDLRLAVVSSTES